MAGAGDRMYPETLHGEALVSDLLQTELMQLDLTGCRSPRYSTPLREDTEEEMEKIKRNTSALNLQKTLSNGHNNTSKIEIISQKETRKRIENGNRRITGNNIPTGSSNSTGSRKLIERDAVDIIEMVEQDAGMLSRKLKLFNRKLKPLPSIHSSTINKRP